MLVTYKPQGSGRRSSTLVVGDQYELLREYTDGEGEHHAVLLVPGSPETLPSTVRVLCSHIEFTDDTPPPELTTATFVGALDATLTERTGTHGKFETTAGITQRLLEEAKAAPNWDKLTLAQREALHMIFSKVARILNGNPNHADNWHDIAGYATLIDKELA